MDGSNVRQQLAGPLRLLLLSISWTFVVACASSSSNGCGEREPCRNLAAGGAFGDDAGLGGPDARARMSSVDAGTSEGGAGGTPAATGAGGATDGQGGTDTGSAGMGGAGMGGAAMGGGGRSAAGSHAGGEGGEDAGPRICPDGTFDDDGDPSNLCTAWTRCLPGQFIAQQGTDRRDQVCANCGDGTFSNVQNAISCNLWTECEPDTYLTQPGTTSSDQRCSPCPSAASPSSECLPEGACQVAGACDPGMATATPASSPAECTACDPGDYCAGGFTPKVQCASGTWDQDADPATCCIDWQACAAGQYMAEAGSATSDRECASCASGTFSDYSNADECRPWTECAPRSSEWPQGGIEVNGTATSDVVCADPFLVFGSPDASDEASSVAIDSSGNVYVSGFTLGAIDGPNAGETDVFVAKFDVQGSLVWARQLGTAADESPGGVAVDESGNVVVAGSTRGALEGLNDDGSIDGFLRKLDASGATLWTVQFGETGSSFTPTGLELDGSGNIHVAGYTYGGSQSSGDAFLRKFDESGAEQWSQQFGGPDEDNSSGLALDSSGNAYVTGFTYGLTTLGSADAFVYKVSASGEISWSQQFGSADRDGGQDVVVDGQDNVYVAGEAGADFAGTNLGSYDLFLRKLDPDGTELWTEQFGTPEFEYGSALAVDGSDHVYMVGVTQGSLQGSNAGAEDLFVRKFDPSGEVLSTQQIGTSESDAARDAVSDASGNVYVVGAKGQFFISETADAFALFLPAESF